MAADLRVILKPKSNPNGLTPWKEKSEGQCYMLQKAKREERKGDEEAKS